MHSNMPNPRRQAAAQKGGKACLARHGRDFYQRIGRLGYQKTLALFGGDKDRYHAFLAARGWNIAVDRLASKELDRRLNQTDATIVSIEVSVLDEDEFGPDFELRAGEYEALDRMSGGYSLF